MKLCIVMTYFNREEQLRNTLRSLMKYDPTTFDVVIVDDASEPMLQPEKYPFDIHVCYIKEKTWCQGDPAWNIGIWLALKKNPDAIILQNAECYHAGDILGYVKEHLTPENYISFGCYSIGKGDPFEVKNNNHIRFDGDNGWYNHPEIWPCGYHFCSAISRENLVKLNGFDERYSFGMGFDDDDLLRRIKLLGLKVEITKDPIVFHQWHYAGRLPNYRELLIKNQDLHRNISCEREIAATHILTNSFS